MAARHIRRAMTGAANRLGLSFHRGAPPTRWSHSTTMGGVIDGITVLVKPVTVGDDLASADSAIYCKAEAPGMSPIRLVEPGAVTADRIESVVRRAVADAKDRLQTRAT